MVSEIPADDERMAQEFLSVCRKYVTRVQDEIISKCPNNDNVEWYFNNKQQETGEPLVSGRERRAMGRDRWGDIYANMPVKKMVALYDYDPQELSPNVDSEVMMMMTPL